MATRLFRSIVVFGTTLGAGTAVVVPLVSSGCSLSMGDDSGDDSWHGIIDAALPPCHGDARCPDAWYVPISDGPWGIIDAPLPDPDAVPPDAGNPDSAAAAAETAQPEMTPNPYAETTPHMTAEVQP